MWKFADRTCPGAEDHDMTLSPRFRLLALTLLLVLPTAAFAQSVGVIGIADEVIPIEKRLEGAREVAVRGYVFVTGTLKGRQIVVGRSGS